VVADRDSVAEAEVQERVQAKGQCTDWMASMGIGNVDWPYSIAHSMGWRKEGSWEACTVEWQQVSTAAATAEVVTDVSSSLFQLTPLDVIARTILYHLVRHA
jgi:hypothetical protein